MTNWINRIFRKLLSHRVKHKSERFILIVAILSYLIHLSLIFLTNWGFLSIDSKFLSNPIAAIYTPFSFILVYEVYLLIFFLPKSISYYIGKQYEIITLIVIRRIFKDLSKIELTSDWFYSKDDLQFTYDVATSLALFFLIYLFYRNIGIRNLSTTSKLIDLEENVQRFVTLKRGIAILLVPVLILLASYTFYDWIQAVFNENLNGVTAFNDINNIFFDEFFTLLIIVDVLLLLASFFYSDQFPKIIRNSGFVISTILLKVSFSVDGIVNNLLIVGAVLFGFLILVIHNLFEKEAMKSS
jgi:hypothetical protein